MEHLIRRNKSWLNRKEDKPMLPPPTMEKVLRNNSSVVHVKRIIFGKEKDVLLDSVNGSTTRLIPSNAR